MIRDRESTLLMVISLMDVSSPTISLDVGVNNNDPAAATEAVNDTLVVNNGLLLLSNSDKNSAVLSIHFETSVSTSM